MRHGGVASKVSGQERSVTCGIDKWPVKILEMVLACHRVAPNLSLVHRRLRICVTHLIIIPNIFFSNPHTRTTSDFLIRQFLLSHFVMTNISTMMNLADHQIQSFVLAGKRASFRRSDIGLVVFVEIGSRRSSWSGWFVRVRLEERYFCHSRRVDEGRGVRMWGSVSRGKRR